MTRDEKITAITIAMVLDEMSEDLDRAIGKTIYNTDCNQAVMVGEKKGLDTAVSMICKELLRTSIEDLRVEYGGDV